MSGSLRPCFEVRLDHLSNNVHDTSHMFGLDGQSGHMVVALAYVLQSRVDLFLDVRVKDLLAVIKIHSDVEQLVAEFGSFDVVRYLIEGGGTVALSRYELRLTWEVEEDDIFMDRTGVVVCQVVKEAFLAVESVTTVQVGLYTADCVLC